MRSGGKGASPGDLSLLFHIVKVGALVVFRKQDVAPPFNKPRLIGKLSLQRYRQLHVLSLDCINYIMSFSIDLDLSILQDTVSTWLMIIRIYTGKKEVQTHSQ